MASETTRAGLTPLQPIERLEKACEGIAAMTGCEIVCEKLAEAAEANKSVRRNYK